jgi:phage N-6-adenine-methyltransferase
MKPLPTPDILGDVLTYARGKTQKIDINAVRVDGGTQMRAGLDDNTVFDYTQAMIATNGWGLFPAVVCYYDGTTYWLADGFHRVQAYRDAFAAPIDGIPADVRAGTRRDAILHAAGANAEHGLRRTNADKRRAVETMLRDEEWAQWSNHEIARRCAVSESSVRNIRAELERTTQIAQSTTRTGGDGRTINTTNIGTNRPAPKVVYTAPAPPAPAAASDNNVPYQNSTPEASWEETTEGTQLSGKAFVEYTDEDWRVAGSLRARMHKEQRGGLTKDEYALTLVPEIVEWLRTYTDRYGRNWQAIDDVGAHSNSTHWTDITKEWTRRGIYYEDDVLKDAIKIAFQRLQEESVTVVSDSETPAAVDDVPVSLRDGYDGDEWYTPEEITRTAHHVMGGIGLDPATCELAQTSVQAGAYYTKVDDGLAQPWTGSVWLNPPYSAPQVWIDKLFAEMAAGRCSQAIVLVNNATETAWFQRLLTESRLVCFPARRLAFWRHDHSNVGARQGQALFYFGNRAEQFYSAFSATGAVLRRLAK